MAKIKGITVNAREAISLAIRTAIPITDNEHNDIMKALDAILNYEEIALPSSPAKKRVYPVTWSDGKFHGVTREMAEGWRKAYPAVDIPRALYAMDQWIQANPDKKKKNYFRFIVNWLSRAQEGGGKR